MGSWAAVTWWKRSRCTKLGSGSVRFATLAAAPEASPPRACLPPSAHISSTHPPLCRPRGLRVCGVAGINVTNVAVVTDVRQSAKEMGVVKGHRVVSVNGTPVCRTSRTRERH